ncbi:hypothetical protein DXV75_06765 [Alteromonas aestuariivivens]|uniref:Uncharacterized protein n=1 Tax=Alteromonas aestuariivivens TaxID=1938339 RepID=A0A3D8M9G4_9ALTE|nr:hypothetical protein [Alteromonas aestuariivivens]RDV26683.1 hypothetical protein DXV75_06765 [Alteromonas aestuariivivens]
MKNQAVLATMPLSSCDSQTLSAVYGPSLHGGEQLPSHYPATFWAPLALSGRAIHSSNDSTLEFKPATRIVKAR